jgi:hypothetical protein
MDRVLGCLACEAWKLHLLISFIDLVTAFPLLGFLEAYPDCTIYSIIPRENVLINLPVSYGT